MENKLTGEVNQLMKLSLVYIFLLLTTLVFGQHDSTMISLSELFKKGSRIDSYFSIQDPNGIDTLVFFTGHYQSGYPNPILDTTYVLTFLIKNRFVETKSVYKDGLIHNDPYLKRDIKKVRVNEKKKKVSIYKRRKCKPFRTYKLIEFVKDKKEEGYKFILLSE